MQSAGMRSVLARLYRSRLGSANSLDCRQDELVCSVPNNRWSRWNKLFVRAVELPSGQAAEPEIDLNVSLSLSRARALAHQAADS